MGFQFTLVVDSQLTRAVDPTRYSTLWILPPQEALCGKYSEGPIILSLCVDWLFALGRQVTTVEAAVANACIIRKPHTQTRWLLVGRFVFCGSLSLSLFACLVTIEIFRHVSVNPVVRVVSPPSPLSCWFFEWSPFLFILPIARVHTHTRLSICVSAIYVGT